MKYNMYKTIQDINPESTDPKSDKIVLKSLTNDLELR